MEATGGQRGETEGQSLMVCESGEKKLPPKRNFLKKKS